MRQLIIAFVTAILCSSSVEASDLVVVRATTTDSRNPINVSFGSSSMLNTIDSLIRNQDSFSSLQTRDFSAFLDYGGVLQAISFKVTGSTATLQIPSTGFSRTFIGSSRNDVENQIEDFLKKNGTDEYGKFLQAMNTLSTVAVSDGNPYSTTAFSAAQAFTDYAFMPAVTTLEKNSGSASESHFGAGLMSGIGSFNSNGIRGRSFTLPLSVGFSVSQRVGVGIDIPLTYGRTEQARVFGAGLNLSVPVKIIVRSDQNRWAWQLTPASGIMASASKDMLAGGVISQTGISSSLSYDFEKVTLTMGNYVGGFKGVPITIAGVHYDPHIRQQIFKNGGKVSVPFKENWIVEGAVITSKFLKDAAVDNYVTVGGEFGWKPDPSKKRYWKVGVYSDVAGQFSSVRAEFGTAWRF